MRLHREGKNILIVFFIGAAVLSLAVYYFLPLWCSFVFLPVFWILFGFAVWFFRDPLREGESEPGDVIAPVDGKVVEIKEVEENEFLKTKCIQVSIFMSPLNVHVCRYPVSGEVIYAKYHPGRYLVAFHPKSSELNERTSVAVKTEKGTEVLFRQIAGAVARRIVLYAEPGNKAKAGKEYGFIKFGSRLDVFLPVDSEILVQMGEKTLGGIQKIAKLK